MRLRVFAAAALLAGFAPAQPPVAFEAASIKPANPSARQRRPGMEGGPGTSDPGRIRYSDISLRDLILLAYRVRPFQLVCPDAKALDAKTFEVAAELPRGVTQAQLRLMLQNLLVERFHLTVGHEERVMPVYKLAAAKNGPKLKESSQPPPGLDHDGFDPLPPAPPNELDVYEDGYPNVPPAEGSWLVVLRSGYARTRQLNASMADLAGILSNQLEKPVIDNTGLTGRYEFTLSWMAAVPASAASAASAGDPGPSVFAALEHQLGLKLEASKGPVEVLAVDHFDKDPVAN
jgi:uncharacterized protein (TIGR03435 family)